MFGRKKKQAVLTENDIYHTVKLPKRPERVEIGMSAVIGSRRTQQDTIFADKKGNRTLAVVCDGMGGLAGGGIASRAAADSIADAWYACNSQIGALDIPDFFHRAAEYADQTVYLQKDAYGNPLGAGTTAAAVIISKDQLHWLSVGDSRIYLIRGTEIFMLNREHNYRLIMNDRLRRGEMTPEQYAAEEYRAEALISYIGMGNVSLMDINRRAYPLSDGDIVLLSSDGLFRSLYDEEILQIVKKNETDMQHAADALTGAVQGRKKQDNTSVVLLQYRAGAGSTA